LEQRILFAAAIGASATVHVTWQASNIVGLLLLINNVSLSAINVAEDS
jgi:hypothetical protein